MSSIDKMSILGIRSFDNTRSETIQFYSPLTLIVGMNGSGKTTIIECLKYATTGQQPPNSKGGAFIHDPKLAGEKEVLAQVKLSFKSTSGAKMVATRSLKLTVQKTTRKMQTLEGQLLMIRNGERVSLSTRVAELDQMLPQYLGVSTAILDNVIFCHQDESLWPLSEPAVLKKKFDEIFEALKYTSAIDNIRKLQKKQREELAKHKIIEEHAKEDKNRGQRAEKRSQLLSDEIEALRANIKGLQRDIKEATEKSDAAWTRAREFSTIVDDLNAKRENLKRTTKEAQELERDTKMMRESDEQLHAMLDEYDDKAKSFKEEYDKQMKKYNGLEQQLTDLEADIGKKQIKRGQCEAEKVAYESRKRQREVLVKETARSHNMRGFDHDLSDEQVQEFMERLQKLSRDQKAAHERARQETDRETRQAQEVLNDLNQKKQTQISRKENARQNISRNDQAVIRLQNTIDSIKIDEGARAAQESRVQQIEDKLQLARSELDTAGYDNKIQEADAQVRILETQQDNLSAELQQAAKHAEETARVDFLRKSLKDSENGLSTMLGAHSERITAIIGTSWDAKSLHMDYQRVLKSKDTDVKEAEQQRDGINRELELVESKRSSLQSELKSKTRQSAECQQIAREALGEDDLEEYEEALRNVETNRDITKSDLDNFQTMGTYYNECMASLKSHDVCRMCERTFTKESDRTKFERKLQKMISQAAQEALKEDLAGHEEDLKKLKDARPQYDSWRRLSGIEIPALETELRRVEQKRTDMLARLEQEDKIVEDRVNVKRDTELISGTIQKIKEYNDSITKFGQDIEELSSKQSQSNASRGLQEIRDEQRTVNQEATKTRTTLTSLTADRERAKGQINTFEIEVLDAKAKLSEAIHKLQEKARITGEVEELRKQVKEQREAIAKADAELQQLAPQISQAQIKLDDVGQRGTERTRQLDQETSKLNASLSKFGAYEQEIQAYIDRGGEQQLARAQRDLDNLREEQENVTADKQAIATSLNKLKEEQHAHGNIKRTIGDNIRYRRSKSAIETLRTEIAELESHDAERDRATYMEEASKWGNERNRLTAEQASVMGQMKSKDDILAQLLQEWNTDYKDAAYKYKEAHVKVEATKAVVEDLGRYGGALDKAIMKYHSMKMEEINRIIEELWKRTYQGTDVDTIIIRGENETQKGNKSYNYRVCMVKQDVEMDMRGRCSAGQKVLASIIIRLALAESFGVACGLIALDEPTTNLDRDNIRALAQSLHAIIKERQRQANFQLIVITHDEEFLREMQCADFCERYYRVSRDMRQKSIIERQDIALVME